MTAAYQRIVAGIAVTAVAYVWLNRRRFLGAVPGGEEAAAAPGRGRRAAPWVAANALAGPVLGVSCYQWALAERGTGVVLPIVALTPLAVVPLARWLEGERPSWRSLLGGVIAVAGAVVLALG